MGMDVMGINPTSETGNYFRANVWSWHPIWDYCELIAPDITNNVENAHSNDGDGLNDKNAFALGMAINFSISDGFYDEWQKKETARLEALPHHPCPYCAATGIRVWYTTKRSKRMRAKFETKGLVFLNPDVLPEYILVKKLPNEIEETKECNGCNGLGHVEDFDCSYGFDKNHLAEFANFCISSGGFKIH